MSNDDFEMINRFERRYEMCSCENCGRKECPQNIVEIRCEKWCAKKDGEKE